MMIYNDNILYLYDGSRWSVALLGGTRRTHDMFLHTALSFTVSHLVNAKLHRCMPKQHRQNCSSFSSESLIDSTVSTQPASGVLIAKVEGLSQIGLTRSHRPTDTDATGKSIYFLVTDRFARSGADKDCVNS